MNRYDMAYRLQILRGDRPRKEVADAVGISTSALTMYENANRVPRDEVKERLAAYYEATVQEIFF